uniref:Homoserine dehydrogenase n=1 Tax=Bionectria ochroleuca TaxID=29856 RepID=A0A8H7KBT5_BIOOC
MSTRVEKVSIAVIGAGGVGSCFVTQLASLAKSRPAPKLSLIYLAIIDRALYHQDYAPIPFDNALEELDKFGFEPPSISDIIHFLSKAPDKVVVVDNTSSQAIAESYPAFLQKGISIITPNKKAFSGSKKLWEDIFSSVGPQGQGPFVYHESSVGAGMPIISTLNDLVETGDRVTRIEGVFSGTMSFLFNSFSPINGEGGSWSANVMRAKQLGYTEPDPRDDLNGLDVARKLTILGRLAGMSIESPTAFPVQSLVPQELSACTEFLDGCPIVRFVGSLDLVAQKAKVGMEWFEKSHPIAGLEGSDNIISFYTERYGPLPLTIRGAGAGGDVTAMGVLGDLIKILRQI